MSENRNKAKVITGVCRSSYMYVRELVHKRDKKGNVVKDSNKTCGTRILIPKKDKKTVLAIKKAIVFAAVKRFGKGVKLKGKNFNYPLRDGDEELENEDVEGSYYEGHYFLNARAYKIPQIADDDAQRVIDNDELDDIIVSGFYYHFSITFKAFDNESEGVRVELNNIMYVKDGERLDGGADAEDDFSDYANEKDEDDDEDDDDD